MKQMTPPENAGTRLLHAEPHETLTINDCCVRIHFAPNSQNGQMGEIKKLLWANLSKH